MNRREFSAGTACVLAAAALGLPGALFAQAKKPEEGTEYLTLGKRVAVDAPPGKVEVIEFFWYSCPHCNAFEPRLEAWIKKLPADVVVKRVPVAFRDDFVPQQRLFYVARGHGQGRRAACQGVPGDPCRTTSRSTAKTSSWPGPTSRGWTRPSSRSCTTRSRSSSKARRAAQLQDAYKVQGVPALGIAGRYYTDGTIAGNMDRALQVTDYLVAEARKSR